jgi:arabinogalactan endo-1,4-beta-galactosidase
MIERNHSNCKYVCRDFYPPRWQRRRTKQDGVYIKGTNIKLWEFPNIASKNTKTNIYQKGSAEFKATIDLKKKKKKECIKVMSPFT